MASTASREDEGSLLEHLLPGNVPADLEEIHEPSSMSPPGPTGNASHVGQSETLERRDNDNDGVTMDTEEQPWYKSPLQLMAMLSNYSTSYNVVNISMVIPILQQTEPGTTSEDAAASASSLLAGMMLGQLLGGYLGDSPVLGRMGALQLVMALQVVASLASALIWTGQGSREQFYLCLAILRFLLGVGAGGVYPLAAVLSAEQGHTPAQQDESKQVHRVVLTFGTQGLGFLTAPLVTVALLYMTTNLNLVWRIILALGSVPGIILMIAHLYRSHSHVPVPLIDDASVHGTMGNQLESNNAQSPVEAHPIESGQILSEEDNDEALISSMQVMVQQLREDTGRWAAIRREPNLIQKLLGTAGTWFCFDVLFYGNALFQGVVIKVAFGASHENGDPIVDLRNMAIRSLILTSIAVPGYAVAGLVMGKKVCCVLQTPKFVMLQGFAAMATLYLAIGLNWSLLRHAPALLLLLYGMTFFFANYGPNTTTFILPSLVFSPECRTTLNGISAAAGKLGALTGAMLFAPAADSIGDANVMLICAGIAVLSFLITWKFVQMHPASQHHLVE